MFFRTTVVRMNERGLLASFLVCKVGVALAALAFIGAALSMYASIERLAEREDLAQLADVIASAIETADSMPGEAELQRDLPMTTQQFEVIVVGERGSGLQVIRIRVIAEDEVERVLILANQVNGGEFTFTNKNPREIHIRKTDTIQLELV